MDKPYQVCNRCVMDTSASAIIFDEAGICNYCTDFEKKAHKTIWLDPSVRQSSLDKLVNEIKSAGAGKKYDCIIGLSGGVDSSWVLIKAIEQGLRPLAVHMDNGWNSELAQNNIANLVQILKVDLYTHVIDWPEYKGLMQAFFDADVVDVELLYDNALLGVNYQTAAKYGMKYILGGTNQATEGMKMPAGWNWWKYDGKNIKSISNLFNGPTIKTFPVVGTFDFIYNNLIKKMQWISFPDFFDYNKAEVLELLQSKYGYKPYPYKHYESVFTRFFQGYILPTKFGIDKRRVHLSSLIISKQMNREEAIIILQDIPYPSQSALDEDKKYFLKKMGWTQDQLTSYLSRPAKAHTDYPSERQQWLKLVSLYKKLFKRSK